MMGRAARASHASAMLAWKADLEALVGAAGGHPPSQQILFDGRAIVTGINREGPSEPIAVRGRGRGSGLASIL